MLLNALPPDGSTAGNLSLRSKLDFDDEMYKKAKRELLDAEARYQRRRVWRHACKDRGASLGIGIRAVGTRARQS